MKARILAIGLAVTFVLSGHVCEAANRIVVSSGSAYSCGIGTVYIYVENDVDLSTLSLPLVARAIPGDLFWRDSVWMTAPTGRLSSALTGTRLFDNSRVDFASPDGFVFFFESATPGTDCLSAGPLEAMLSFKFGVPSANFSGYGLEIDTMASAPCFNVEMLRCSDQAPVVIDEFVKGFIEFLHGGHPNFPELESDSIAGMGGASLQNQITCIDPEADPIGYELLSGPGEVHPLSGLWTWGTRRQDAGEYTVVVDVFQVHCGPGTFMTTSFPVTVTPHPEGDVNCDGQSDALDLAEIIDHLFAGIPLEPCPE